MKKTVLLLILFIAVSCSNDPEGIFVKFQNISNTELQNIEIGNQNYGRLSPNESTEYIHFSEFGTDTGMPDVFLKATANNVPYESVSKYYWCGTEKSNLENGHYTVTIELIDNANEDLLLLQFKD